MYCLTRSKKPPLHINQDPGMPKWSTKGSQELAVKPSVNPRTKREAELESALRILQTKLEYTEMKIMESENNKALLKTRLDKLILQLTKAGYDPNLKVPHPVKQISHQAMRQRPKTEEIKVTAIEEPLGPSKAVLVPFGKNRPAKVSAWQQTKKEESNVRAIDPSRPVLKAVIMPWGTNRPAKISDESWAKLLALANEYEQRLNIVKNLEEQEKYVKQRLKPTHNIPVTEAREVEHATAYVQR